MGVLLVKNLHELNLPTPTGAPWSFVRRPLEFPLQNRSALY